MLIHDKIYGRFEITDPIIIELMNTAAFERLKGICQFGIPDKYYNLIGYSRFEHSVGVYIFLNKLGASEEEQVAGLLHDISHTAFSHLVDWVVGDAENKEDFQNKRHLAVLEQSEISNILKKYGFDPKKIADHHRFRLLEQDIPDLCADRIDYVLRESLLDVAKQCLPDLTVFDGQITFLNEQKAVLFADNFLSRQTEHWASYEAVTRYAILSDLLRKAIQRDDILFDDLLKSDDFVINKIIQTKKNEYLNALKLLENKNLNFLPKAEKSLRKKFRYVDPKILIDSKPMRLSEINEDFKKRLEETRILNTRGVRPGILPEGFIS